MTVTPVSIAIAVIHRDGEVLIGLRDPGSALAGYWEFPGGKVEPGETFEQAVVREVAEETGLRIEVQSEYPSQDFTYEHARVFLRFFRCTVCRGGVGESVPARFRWVKSADLHNYKFPPANADLLQRLSQT